MWSKYVPGFLLGKGSARLAAVQFLDNDTGTNFYAYITLIFFNPTFLPWRIQRYDAYFLNKLSAANLANSKHIRISIPGKTSGTESHILIHKRFLPGSRGQFKIDFKFNHHFPIAKTEERDNQ